GGRVQSVETTYRAARGGLAGAAVLSGDDGRGAIRRLSIPGQAPERSNGGGSIGAREHLSRPAGGAPGGTQRGPQAAGLGPPGRRSSGASATRSQGVGQGAPRRDIR